MKELEFDQFRIKTVEVKDGGTKFKVEWEQLYNPQDGQAYRTRHVLEDYAFNNEVPSDIFDDIAKHIPALNKHQDNTQCFADKIKLWNYGSDSQQVAVKIDYSYRGSSEAPSKGTTGKVLLSSQYYEDADSILQSIDILGVNLYQYIVKGEKFEPEMEALSFESGEVNFGAKGENAGDA